MLRDGSTVHVRQVRREDEPELLRFFRDLSPESVRLRFFSAAASVGWAAHWAADMDGEEAFGLVATSGAGERVVGHGAWVRKNDRAAEIALELADPIQGRGLGTLLVGELAGAAGGGGGALLEADVLADNRRMLGVFRESGFPDAVHSRDGQVVVELATSATAETLG